MMTVPSPPGPIDDALSILTRSHRISFGVMLTIILQTIALVGWLVQLRAEVTQLKVEHHDMAQRLDRIDREGTRALTVVLQRQMDVVAINSAQEARLRELETRLSDYQRIQVENRFWIDQLVAFMREYSHAPFPRPTLKPPLTTVPP
jgi:capsule polysaccharide export protein KpsE/RkpR